jgi:type IV secretion system protein VirB10
VNAHVHETDLTDEVRDRGAPIVFGAGSFRARLVNSLAIVFIVLVGAAFLFYWYAGFATRERAGRVESARRLVRSVGDTNLPALEIFDAPRPTSPAVAPDKSAAPAMGITGPASSVRPAWPVRDGASGIGDICAARLYASGPASSAWRRRLAAPVLWRSDRGAATHGREADSPASSAAQVEAAAPASQQLPGMPAPSTIAVVSAQMIPTRRLLLTKGSAIDCTLETAIDSQLPGLATCLTAVDVFGADGSVVLLERGTQLVGEVHSDVRPGQSRVFVLWTEARTPAGIVVSLASPATDPLGRAGVAGSVDQHFAERFGAALLISVIDGAIQAVTTSRGSGSAVVVNPDASQTILTEILRNTIAIPPTIRVPHGTRVAVLVARDVDFRSVYTLSAVR